VWWPLRWANSEEPRLLLLYLRRSAAETAELSRPSKLLFATGQRAKPAAAQIEHVSDQSQSGRVYGQERYFLKSEEPALVAAEPAKLHRQKQRVHRDSRYPRALG